MLDNISSYIEQKNIEYTNKINEEFHLMLKVNGKITDFCISTESTHNSARLFDIKIILSMILASKQKEVYLYHNHPNGTFMPSIEDYNITNTLFTYLKVFGIDIKDHMILCGEHGIYHYKGAKEKIFVVDDTGFVIEKPNLIKDEIYLDAIDLYKTVKKDKINNIISANNEDRKQLIDDFLMHFNEGLDKILSINENIKIQYFGNVIKELSFYDNMKVDEKISLDFLTPDLNSLWKKNSFEGVSEKAEKEVIESIKNDIKKEKQKDIECNHCTDKKEYDNEIE